MNTATAARAAHRARTLALLFAAALVLRCGSGVAAQADEKELPSEAEIERQLADARKRLDAAAREVADLSMSLSGRMMPEMRMLRGFGGRHAVLGINLGPLRDTPASEGVEIVSVSPGGAAAEAGLRAGDVLTDLNGVELEGQGARAARRSLLGAIDDVEAGDEVPVAYRRAGKRREARLKARPLADQMIAFGAPAMPGPHATIALADAPSIVFRRADGVFGSAELVALTPKLGHYFGTEEGLLVVRAPEDSRLKLEEGDVILDIDGRKPSSPSHALRILGTYQGGEKLKLNVLRARKRLSFEITVPEDLRGHRFERPGFFDGALLPPLELEPPMPPMLPMLPGAYAIAEPLPREAL